MNVQPDVIGGFMFFMNCMLGVYCLRDGSIDTSCILSWGMLCCINGVLDSVAAIDRTASFSFLQTEIARDAVECSRQELVPKVSFVGLRAVGCPSVWSGVLSFRTCSSAASSIGGH